jgi:hypothetical protein
MSFQTVHNHQEGVVYELITAIAPRYPALSGNEELLEDVACVALNSLPPRYIRHEVDLHFFMTEGERALTRAAARKAVEAAFERIGRADRA